jgi:hypothetical protein
VLFSGRKAVGSKVNHLSPSITFVIHLGTNSPFMINLLWVCVCVCVRATQCGIFFVGSLPPCYKCSPFSLFKRAGYQSLTEQNLSADEVIMCNKHDTNFRDKNEIKDHIL